MSVTPQRLRTSTEMSTNTKSLIKAGTWSKYFPTKFSTEISSCTFVKKLITVAISNITYLRSMFPESAYANRSMDGLPLKILKGKNENPGAQKVANWLIGAFDALEKKYLRELMLLVYKDESNPDVVEEMYTFKFSYPGGLTACQLLQGKEDVKKITDDDIYKSTQHLLRSLVILTQGMNQLDNSTMTMKLTYYDDVTPTDYEPAGFIPTPLVQPQLPAGSVALQSGDVATLHHTVQLGVRAIAGKVPDHLGYQQSKSNLDDEDDSMLIKSTSPGKNISVSPSITKPSAALPSTTRSQLGSPIPQSQNSLAPSSVSLLSESSSKVQCLCMNSHPDPIMLDCYYCNFQQHGACYRIISIKDIPTKHCCVRCSKEQGAPCTDTKLVTMSDNPAIIETCLFRRVVLLLSNLEVVNVEKVVESLNVESDTAEAIIKKLGDIGCLEDGGKEGQWMILKGVLEEKVILKYLGRKSKKRKQELTGSQENGLSISYGDGPDAVLKEEVVTDSSHGLKSVEKSRIIEVKGQRGIERRHSKRRKVSEVTGDLQI